jgi:Mg2+-importing ATPase
VIRTRRPFLRSTPGRLLLVTTLVMIAATFVIPYLPLVGILGFVPLPAPVVATLCVIAGCYMAATEVAKRWFLAPRSAKIPLPRK